MPKIEVSNEVIAKLSDDATKAINKENAALKRKIEVLTRENETLKRDKEKVKRLYDYFKGVAEDLANEFPYLRDDDW